MLTTTITFTPRRHFRGFGIDGQGRGEQGIIVGGADVGGNENKDVKSS